jgi:hypothetical protein
MGKCVSMKQLLERQGGGEKKARTEVVEHVLKDKEKGELWEHSLP